jgi:hypothetical protein
MHSFGTEGEEDAATNGGMAGLEAGSTLEASTSEK